MSQNFASSTSDDCANNVTSCSSSENKTQGRIVKKNDIDGIQFDTRLNDEEIVRYKYIKHAWDSWKKGQPCNDVIISIYDQSPNPFKYCMKLVANCIEYNDCKPKSLAYHLMERLKIWSDSNSALIANHLDSNLKHVAFHFAISQKNFSFLKLSIDTYDIVSENKYNIDYIEELLSKHRYREVYLAIMALNIQKQFTVDRLLVPLILQDKLNLVNEYLSSCPDQVEPLIEYLDNLLVRNSSVRISLDCFITETGVPDIKWEKLHHKPLGKFVAKLCSTWKVPIEFCKNLYRNRTSGGLRFLVHQRYSENSVSESAWEDMVKDNLDRCPEVQQELIELIDQYDPKEALKWAKLYDFSIDDYPSGAKYLLSADDSQDTRPVEIWGEEPSTSHSHYQLSLPLSRVIFVDTHRRFYDFLEIVKSYEFVGVDSEWKPSFGATQNNVALIQIATTEHVYLLDTLTLNGVEDEPLWKMLRSHIFENVNITKIGFGLENDLREIRNSLPGLSTLKVRGLGLLELGNLWKSLKEYKLSFPFNADGGGEGLSSLVEHCFGVTLKKHEQCSNWENRPLRDAQLEYAALDSYVLVEIFLVFKRLCMQNNINFDELCYAVMVENKPLKSLKVKKNMEKENNHVTPLLAPANAKFFIDVVYEPLITALRRCGIDTLPLPTDNTWTEIVNLALDNNRFIVISSNKGQNLNLLSESHYLIIRKNDNDYLNMVFKYFNIDSSSVKKFGRCLACNSDEIGPVNRHILKEHYDRYQFNSRPRNETVDENIKLPFINTSNAVEYRDFDPDAFLSDDDDEDFQIHSAATASFHCAPTHNATVLNENDLQKLSMAPLDFRGFTDSIITTAKEFIVCNQCGKCFWQD